jgi:hypothetical protein
LPFERRTLRKHRPHVRGPSNRPATERSRTAWRWFGKLGDVGSWRLIKKRLPTCFLILRFPFQSFEESFLSFPDPSRILSAHP